MQDIPQILGIVNMTSDSFSDGGLFLDEQSAIAHANGLWKHGANIIDLGPAASNPNAELVDSKEEIRRLSPVITVLHKAKIPVSVDSFRAETQRYAISRGVEFLNDITGFSEPSIYADLAVAKCKLIVMHSMQAGNRATESDFSPHEVWLHSFRFFEERIATLINAGIAPERLILDPGMGFFLSANPEASLRILANLEDFSHRFCLPLLISASRKSFLRKVTGKAVEKIGSATLAAELLAAMAGVSYIRTHDAGALADGLAVLSAVNSNKGHFSSKG
ncbi:MULTISPECIES: dihydropteroate synthase [Alphaproteobacteria]|uniref:Dihydropteroate synthase n=1 Tax=Novosphingobium resinovorum TaxID=158500 RepID=A0A1D8AGT5_9SPHN|nr:MULTISPECIES: dihydropteroate synthase [Alphaproteobacteria]AOR81335.1 dihydropteroate synthase [Novosphingobium resinovorum]